MNKIEHNNKTNMSTSIKDHTDTLASIIYEGNEEEIRGKIKLEEHHL